MISFKQYMNEGLVKVPPVMQKEMENFFGYWVSRLLEEMIKDNYGVHDPEGKMLKEIIKKIEKQRGFRKPSGTVKYKQNVIGITIPVESAGLPANYDLKEDGVVYFLLDYENVISSPADAGVWKPQARAIVYNMQTRAIRDFFRQKNYADAEYQLKYLLDNANTTLEHEMVHMMQSLYFSKLQPKSVHMKAGYKDLGDDYWTSPVEFESHLVTAVRNFKQDLETFVHLYAGSARYNKEDDDAAKAYLDKQLAKIKDMAEVFVGAKKPSMSGMASFTSPFFKALKNKAPARYKVAVRKFMSEIEPLLQQYGKSRNIGYK